MRRLLLSAAVVGIEYSASVVCLSREIVRPHATRTVRGRHETKIIKIIEQIASFRYLSLVFAFQYENQLVERRLLSFPAMTIFNIAFHHLMKTKFTFRF